MGVILKLVSSFRILYEDFYSGPTNSKAKDSCFRDSQSSISIAKTSCLFLDTTFNTVAHQQYTSRYKVWCQIEK